MSQVTMEIIEPYNRQGNDVIVNIRKNISSVGVPPKIELLYLQLTDCATMSDDQIRELAMERIYEHIEKIPDIG